MADNFLAGIRPNKEDTTAVAAMDAIAEGMNDRGFDALWSQPASGIAPKFDDSGKRRYLIKLATTGRMALAAAHAGTSRNTVRAHCQRDPVFAASCQEAKEYFRDILVGEMYRRGVEGFDQEVIGGRNKDQIFTVKTYSDKLLTTLGQIHIKEMQKPTEMIVAGQQTTTIVNNQFDMENMPVEDMAMFKQLLLNQQKRLEDSMADAGAIEGEVSKDGQ